MTEATRLSAGQHHRPFYALGLRLLAMAALAIMFASVKWLGEHGVHLVESIFYRQLLALPVPIAAMMMGEGLSMIRTARPGAHFGRAYVGLIGMVFNFGAVILLPLAEATTIGFTVPIFATILSVIFLGERPGIHRWLAVLTGFLGVVLIVGAQGHLDLPWIGFIVALTAALVTSCVSLLLRQIGKTEHPTTTVFYFSLLTLPPLGLAMLHFGQTHSLITWAVILLMGISGGLAQLFMTGALRWGPVSLVLPMDYSALVWSTLLGWLLWRQWPGPGTWAGAAVIAGSSLYIVWREHVRHREISSRGVSVS